MIRIFHNWTIDKKPAPWATVFRVDALTSVGPLTIRTVRRDSGSMYNTIKVYVFDVTLAGTNEPLPCSIELSEPQPLEEQRKGVEEFHDGLVIAWAEALKDKA